MKKIKKFIEGELTGWKTPEILWLLFCCISVIVLSQIMGDNIIGIISALTGVLYTVIAGKGKMSCYFFGVINTLLYGLISFKLKLYGEVMLNWGWYLPMMFAGFFCWKRKTGAQQIVRKTALTVKGRIIAALLSAAGIGAYAVILALMNGRSPVLDSTTTVLSVTAMILTVKRCIEQWLIWTAVNVISIIMWLRVYFDCGNSAASLLMWCIALANGIIFFITWFRDMEPEKEQGNV